MLLLQSTLQMRHGVTSYQNPTLCLPVLFRCVLRFFNLLSSRIGDP